MAQVLHLDIQTVLNWAHMSKRGTWLSYVSYTHKNGKCLAYCLRYDHIRDKEYKYVCIVATMCISVPFCACECVGWRVIVIVVIRGCAREAVGCCFEARWDRMRRERLRKTSSNRHPNIQTLAPLRVHFSQLGPCVDMPWPSATTYTYLNLFQRRPLGCCVHKPKEAREQGERGMSYLFGWHGDTDMIMTCRSVDAKV